MTLLLALAASAERVTAEQALQQARQFMTGKSFTAAKPLTVRSSRHLAPGQQADAALYVVNAQGQGFVIVSGDDRTVPILGYSDSGQMDTDNMPEHIKAWMQGYADQIAWLEEHPNAAPAAKTLSAPSISPLLGNTKWNQSHPYNSLCPVDPTNADSKRCVTGCVATAMAQVMYYHQWPAQTTAEIPSYTTEKQKIVVPAIAAGTAIDWANMLPSYSGVTATEEQENAVGLLMLMCGTSVEMDYTAYSSGAISATVADALKDYFDYDAATTHLNRVNYKLAPWNEIIYDELSAGRPVFYHGQSSGGGHAFVVDGYDQDDYFHVNWGWGGSSNGYFLLSILDPGSNSGIGASSSTDGYSFSQGAIVGAQPNTGYVPETPETVVAMTTTGISIESDEVSRSTMTEDFSFAVTSRIFNRTGETYNFEYAYGIFDDSDNLVYVSSYLTREWATSYGTSSFRQTLTFGANFSNGTYRVKAISREKDTDIWHSNFGSDRYYVLATISGNTLTLEARPIPTVLDLSMSLTLQTPTPRVNKKCVMSATVTNNGTDFNNEVYFLLDGERVGGRVFEVDAAQTADLTFSFTPKETGTKTVSVALRQWNSESQRYELSDLATCQVTIEDALDTNLSVTSMEVTNAVNGVVPTNSVQVRTVLQNQLGTEYDDDVRFYVWQKSSDGSYTTYGYQLVSVVVPGNGTKTVDVTFNDMQDGEYIIGVYYKTKDNSWKSMKQIYSTVKNETPTSDNITFADALVKQLCVEQWDTNGDGELSKEEAAAVTSLGNVFKDKDITTFKELQYFSNLKAINSNSFYNCKKLTAVTIPTSVTTIEDQAFFNCSQLASVNIPTSVTVMGNFVFSFSGLTSVTIPNSVTTLGDAVFNYSRGLKAIKIPKSVTKMGFNPVNGCSSIVSIEVESGNTVFDSRNGCNAIINTATNELVAGCKSTVIPSGVTTIGKYAFGGCLYLQSISIPETVKTIGTSAFYWCNSLTTITIPSTVTAIGEKAFQDCTQLAEVHSLIESPFDINANVFDINDNFTTATLYVPVGTKTLYEAATGWKQFQSIVEEGGSGGEELKDGDVFTALTDEGVEMTFKVISVAEKTCQVGTGASYSTSSAIDVSAEGTITVPATAKGLTVVSLAQGAFYNCSMTSLLLPATIKSIGYYSVNTCSKLESLNIPAATTKIDNYAFGSSEKLTAFTVDDANPNFSTRDGMLMNKGGTRLLSFPGGRTGEFTIPADVPQVNNGAFSGCQLNKLTFPETVTWVGGWVATSCPNLQTLVWNTTTDLSYCGFRYNSKLADIQVCEGTTQIPKECFDGSAITDFIVPNSVMKIDELAFSDCRQLERLSFSTNVSSFPSSLFPFRNCNSLNAITITYNGEGLYSTTLPDNTFPEVVYQNATLYVPTGSKEFFETTDGWKQFQNIVEQGDPIVVPTEPEGDIWGYYAYDGNYCGGLKFGSDYTEWNAAMYLPGDETLQGAKITSIRIPVYDDDEVYAAMSQGTAWLATSLESGEKVRSLSMAKVVKGQYTDLVLDQPYTITADGVYVGITCPEKVWICYMSGNTSGGFYFKPSTSDSWTDRSNNYMLPVQVRVTGHHIPNVSVHFGEANVKYTVPGKETTTSFTVYNNGLQAVEYIDYTLTVDGNTETGQQSSFIFPGIGQKGTMSVSITGPSTPKEYLVTLVADKVNDIDNAARNMVSENLFTNLSREVERRTVMEEGTGTWCGYCPRGMAGMKRAKDLYGDRFIGIAIHSGDIMDISRYNLSFSGYPSCYVDRNPNSFDPSNMNALEQALAKPTSVDVTVKGVWNEDKTQVIATSSAEFLAKTEGSSVMYALVGDGLKGSTSSWYQINNYAGSSTTDDYMKPYCDGTNPLTDVTYNDVLIASSISNWNNLAEAYPATISMGSKLTNSYTLELPTTGELAEAIDKEQVYVVAIVLNPDGTIANAAKAKVTVDNSLQGDVNGDGLVNGTDLVALTNMIMEVIEKNDAADVNHDGQVNGTDYVALVDIIMSAEPNLGNVAASRGNASTASIGVEPMDISAGESRQLTITLDNPDMDVTMVQMDMHLPDGLSLQRDEEGDYDYTFTDRLSYRSHTLNIGNNGNGMHRLLLASQKNALVAGFQGGIIHLTLCADESFEGGDIVFDRMLCTSPSQQETRPQPVSLHLGVTTDIDNMATQQGQPTVYSLLGNRLEAPRKGVNIINGKKIVK